MIAPSVSRPSPMTSVRDYLLEWLGATRTDADGASDPGRDRADEGGPATGFRPAPDVTAGRRA